MDTTKLRTCENKLRTDIKDLIKEFENKTLLRVKRVSVTHTDEWPAEQPPYSIIIETNVVL